MDSLSHSKTQTYTQCTSIRFDAIDGTILAVLDKDVLPDIPLYFFPSKFCRVFKHIQIRPIKMRLIVCM